MIFEDYAEIYDTYYSSKKYSEEVEYVLFLAKNLNVQVRSVLDIGCGTAGHLIPIAKKQINVKGFDFSKNMLEMAKKKLKEEKVDDFAQVVLGDARSFRDGGTYDLVISMFAVMGYLNTNEDFLAGLKTAAAHMDKNGLFIFDVWFGPTVLNELPETRVQELDQQGEKILRLVRPSLDEIKQLVKVRYDIISNSNNKKIISETHSMRFFFIQELKYLLQNANLEMLNVYPFMEYSREPRIGDWNISVVSRLKI